MNRANVAKAMTGLVVMSAGLVAVPALAAVDPTSLVQNGDLEQGSGATFTCFQQAGYGSTATYTAVLGRGGVGRAAQLSIGNYAGGDRKLIQTQSVACAPKVAAGSQYDLRMWYSSTTRANLTLFRHTASGWQYWTDLEQSPAAQTFTQRLAVTPVIPAGTDQISWGMGLSGNGKLIVDDLEMFPSGAGAPTPTGPPPVLSNTGVPNADLAQGATVPACFQTAGFGVHTVHQGFSADIPAGTTGRSWRIELSGYMSGDRKLIPSEAAGCAPSVSPGDALDVSVFYTSTSAQNSVTLFRHSAAGWAYWTDLQALPPATTWTKAVGRTPIVPADTDRVSFGISTSANGVLQTYGYGVAKVVAPTPTPPPPPPPTSTGGRWTTVIPPGAVRAMHATLLKDGRVLLIAGSGNQASDFISNTFKTMIWNPATNDFKEIATPADMFCSGHVTMPDGRILIAGGNAGYPGVNGSTVFKGAKFTHVFDPTTDSFTRISDMTDAHWYPTLTKLESGDVWSAGGLNADGGGTVATEMFSNTEQRWLGLGEVPQTFTFWGSYPHMYLLGDGKLFYAGAHTFGANRPGTGASLYDWRTGQIGDVPGLRNPQLRDQAGSVLLPPAQNQTVLIAGGGDTVNNAVGTDEVDLINLNASSPAYVAGPTLPGGPRGYVNLVTLPDRTVLATGGAQGNRGTSIISSSIYSPITNTWRSVAADQIGRNYHSSALLLPDGRVAVFGGNPADNSYEFRISVYEPPYLFAAGRPTVTGPPDATYGQNLTLGVSGSVVSASLTSPMSATHQVDTNARLVDLPITDTGSTRTVTVPANRALLPPGPYMLTVVDANNVPSIAKWINIR